MRRFCYVTGELTEVQRYINVPMRWRQQYPSRERREFWLAADSGNDVKLTVHSRVMPARRGHRVNVLMLDDLVVGLANLTTGRQVNFVQVDPPLLVRRCDGPAALGILGIGIAVEVRSATGAVSERTTRAKWPRWPSRTRSATRSKPPTGVAICSRSAAG